MCPTLKHLFLTPFQVMVDELFSIRDLAADCPILIVFRHSRLCIFHHYVVVYKTLRIFQQFKAIHCRVSNCNGLCMYEHNHSINFVILKAFYPLVLIVSYKFSIHFYPINKIGQWTLLGRLYLFTAYALHYLLTFRYSIGQLGIPL